MDRAQATAAAIATKLDRPHAPHRMIRGWAAEDFADHPFVLGDRTLPGAPEIAIWALPARAVFVWWCHMHPHGCVHSDLGRSRRAFWQRKTAESVERDDLAVAQLQAKGWRVHIVRTCQLIADPQAVRETLRTFLHTGNVDPAA